jgi:hypothetical protein
MEPPGTRDNMKKKEARKKERKKVRVEEETQRAKRLMPFRKIILLILRTIRNTQILRACKLQNFGNVN